MFRLIQSCFFFNFRVTNHNQQHFNQVVKPIIITGIQITGLSLRPVAVLLVRYAC